METRSIEVHIPYGAPTHRLDTAIIQVECMGIAGVMVALPDGIYR